MTHRNQKETNCPLDICVHQLFEQQVIRTPSRVAVCFDEQQLTYSELNAKANQLAHFLLKLGVGAEVLVGLCVELSHNMIVGLLAILKAGGVYVPLDPGDPEERLSFILEDSQLKLLVTESKLITDLPSNTADTVVLDTNRSAIAIERLENPVTQLIAENSAYVLYTSGATGKPRRVQIEHRSLVNLLGSMRQDPEPKKDDVLVSVATPSFGIAGLEWYLPLTVGSSVKMSSRKVSSNNEQLSKTQQPGVAKAARPAPVAWRLLPDRNGDLARCLPTGDIEFVRRTDDQVKIRGFRVDTGEIESLLKKQLGVRQAIVVAKEGVFQDTRLIAYFVPHLGAEPKAKDLQSLLKQKFPSHMVPAAFVRLEAMPLTADGQVDTRALPLPMLKDFAVQESFVPPRDSIESQLAKVWERVFGRKPIGVHDDFFDLGGHSLLAVRIMQQVEQDFHKKLPVATILESSTVEQMARLLRQEEWSPEWSSLVVLQAGGSKPPFFCVHGIGGEALSYRDLARHLGPDQPVYGLQAQGLDGKHPCHERVENMAEHYIEEIRSVQPVGPYYLGGLSFGGVVAFEMARQLHAQGQQVGLVALFDTWTTNYKPKVSRTTKFLLLPARLKSLYLLRKARNQLIILRRKTSLLFLPQALRNVRKACSKAANRYAPTSYAGRVVLFRARDQALVRSDDPFLGWENLTLGGVEVREIIGDHVSIVSEPHVANLAIELAACLERSRHAYVNNRSPREIVTPKSKSTGSRQSPTFTERGSKIASGL